LLSASSTFAERRLRAIKAEIEGNISIQQDFGIEPSSIWTSSEIQTNNGVNLLALGKGSQITGERPDIIILDDIETEDEAKSEICRSSLKEYFYKTVMNRPAPDGRIIMIGSISNKLAFLNNFSDEDQKKVWTVKTYKTSQCHSIWQDKWSDDDLRAKKVELAAFAGIYEALYESDVSQIQKYTFKKEWLRYYTELPKDISAGYVAVDPAIGMAVHNDYTAVVGGVSDTRGNLYVTICIKKRYNIDTLELFSVLFNLYDTQNIAEFGIESVGFQKFIKVFFEQECMRRNKFPNVREIQHDTRVTKEARISSLAPMFQKGQIYIKADMYDLISEYEAYPEISHDDTLDSLSILKDMIMPVTMLTRLDKGLIPKYRAQNKGINF
jgi:predicted phage terminase large subunit-like protein